MGTCFGETIRTSLGKPCFYSSYLYIKFNITFLYQMPTHHNRLFTNGKAATQSHLCPEWRWVSLIWLAFHNGILRSPGVKVYELSYISHSNPLSLIFSLKGEFSVLQVSFNMQRLSGYFLIQVIALILASVPSNRLLEIFSSWN